MLYALPPAGDPVRLRPAPGRSHSLEAHCSPYRVSYYNSGTAALAATLQAAVALRPRRAPEVVLPAYACPHLVSAVLFAGARPVLVDLATDRPWLALEQVEAALTEQTVAVVAVHLFGVRERLEALRRLTQRVDALLIEDSAQALATQPGGGFQGDFAVLSFGRGKPVSLLGGGAALAADAESAKALPRPQENATASGLSFQLKAGLYNGLRQPQCYWLPQAIPGLGLGQTRFEPLREIGAMDATRRALLPTNLHAYLHRPAGVQREYDAMLARLDSSLLTGVAGSCGDFGRQRLLRYPLLFASGTLRDRAYRELQSAGLGPTRMYEQPLPAIAGVAAHLYRCGSYPNAERFASRLLTLPTHSSVRRRDVQRVEAVLRQVLDELEQDAPIGAREG